MRNELNPCPCCGRLSIIHVGTYEICEVCGWEDDPFQSENPDYPGGANELSLNQARSIWTDKNNFTKKQPRHS